MPVLTDPRQIVSPLPACLMKEIPDETRLPIDRGSTEKPSRARADKRNTVSQDSRAEARTLDAENGAGPDAGEGAIAQVAGREIRDQLWRHKVLVECWSLNTSKEFHGELDPMTPETKELCQQEAILWAARERDRDKWMAFE